MIGSSLTRREMLQAMVMASQVPAPATSLRVLAPHAWTGITDTANRNRPALPILPAKGGTYVDQVFGKTILRVTDETDGTSNMTVYSYWSSFNKDSTKLIVNSDESPFLYDFDGAAMRATNRRQLFASSVPTLGGVLRWDNVIWSGVNPDELFSYANNAPLKLYKYNVATNTYTLIKDIGLLGSFSGQGVWQLSRSIDDNRFAFTRKDPGTGDYFGYSVFDVSADAFVLNVADSDFDECQVDKSGQFLVFKNGTEGKAYNLDAGTSEDLTDGAPDYMMGHSDNGTGFTVGLENYNGTIRRRRLATPHTHFQVYDPVALHTEWPYDQHLSLLSDDESWMVVSTYQNTFSPTNKPLENEIFQVTTDGSAAYRRLCHHRGGGTGYYDAPRANTSRDGRYVAYTSTWEGTLGSGRRDFFVVKVF